MSIYLHNLRLPSAYQEVEYIESTGTQYIDTGYKPTTYPKIDFTFLYVGGGISSETWLPLFGRRDYYGYGRAADFALFVTKTSPYYLSPNRGGFDPGSGSGVTISKDIKYNIVIDKGQFYLDGVLKSGASTNNTITSSNYPVFLFDNNDNGSRTNRNTQIRLYSCKLYNSGVLERDFVPCYRKSDGVIGLYDLVNSVFYTNSGTGTFSKGNDVTMSEVKNIYIGEVLKPDKGPLRFIANTAGSTIKLRKYGSPTSVTLETSTDGNNWTPYTIGDVLTLNNVGDTIYWRNTSETDTGFSTQLSNYYQFEMTGSLKAEGIVNYLLNKNSTTTLSNWCFIYLFSGCPITTAPALPSITLANYCYQYMFDYCSSLVTAPSLPATTLGTQSYYAMFSDCENLETLPALPSTTIADYCYYQMFYKCYKIALSETKTGAYQTEYRIPTSGTGTYGTQAFYMMFDNTGGTYRTDPTINRTYYTSNTVV